MLAGSAGSARGRAALTVLLSVGLSVGAAVATASGAAATGGAQPVQTAPKPKAAPLDDKLGDHDRELLAAARDKKEPQVTVLLATERGQTAQVDQDVTQLGGKVGYRDDRLGYVRATIPTASVEKAVGLAKVVKVDLKENVQRDDPRPDGAKATASEAAVAKAAAAKPVLGRQPTLNPYLPIGETGAAQIRTATPAFDGRGVTIGILDSGVDLDHPALQTTTTGERKIVDWVTAVDPLLEGDQTWRPMLTPVTGPSFAYQGVTYRAPAGSFFVSRFSEAITAPSEPAGDINRDGDTTDTFGILYRASDGAIWVDQDQDGDFTDGPLLRPYREQQQVQHFGVDNPRTAIAETTPFVVEYRRGVDLTPAGLPGQKADFVNIGIVEDAHGSHVAGITAANGAAIADGAAPGAKLVSSRACTWGGGCTNVALTEGMIDLVVNRHVDVVNMSIGGLPALNDGANARAELYNRLIDEFGVQIFLSAGNSGPGLNTIGDPAVAADAVSVGSSISKATWLANYGSAVSAPDQLHNFSSRGPREDGGFKPEVVAPGSAVSTVPRWLKQPDVAEVPYTLPIGYAMFQGTSMASPQAAGAAAVILSATRQSDVPVTPALLRKALESTATPIPDVPVFAQGLGRIAAAAALDGLLRYPGTATPGYVVSAPVCTPISEFLSTPDTGSGIYNRCGPTEGGQAVGQTRSYQVTITRTSGLSSNRLHTITLRGNDGTFTAPASVSLPRGKPVTITVTATPRSEGAHSVLLLLDDAYAAGIEHASLHTVVAARQLAAPSYATQVSTTVERNRTKSLYVDVPAGTRALQVVLSGIATGSQTRFIATDPYGVTVDSTSSLDCYSNFTAPATQPCPSNARAYLDPIPGVWELSVESRRTTPTLVNPLTLTAAAQGVVVTPELVTLPTATVGVPTAVDWTVRNAFGPTRITLQGGALGSAATARPTIADGVTQTYSVTVPAGATRLDARIGNPSDLSADLDLTVYDAAGVIVAQSADGDSEEAVSIPDPLPGTYTVEVDGFAVPAGTTLYDYRDVVTAPAYGTLQVPALSTALAAGQQVTVSGVIVASTPAGAGRQLFGTLGVLNDRGALLGTGSVVVTRLVPAG